MESFHIHVHAERAAENGATDRSVSDMIMPDASEQLPTLGSSLVTVCKVVTSALADARGHLDAGWLLQFMDIAACLAAEKHCQVNCVTLAMDDLHFDAVVPVGATVRLDGRINRIFGSSMEVGVVVYMDRNLASSRGVRQMVCSACFTFVALHEGKPVKVRQAVAATLEERFAAALADERKKWRTKRMQLEKEATSYSEDRSSDRADVGSPHRLAQTLPLIVEPVQPRTGVCGLFCCSGGMRQGHTPHALVACELASIELTQLVLPNHANHHGNTFGGQLMAWMSEAATVVASEQARLLSVACAFHVSISIFDAMKFLAPSKVGDRVLLRARVTRVFHQTMEVAVDVSVRKTADSEWTQTNSGFLTVSIIVAKTGATLALVPTEPPADEEGRKQHEAAMVRRRLRTQRRQMFSLRPDAMHYSRTLLEELSICNVMGLLRVAHSTALEWRTLPGGISAGEPLSRSHRRGTSVTHASSTIGLQFSRDSFGIGTSSLKVEVHLNASAETVFEHVSKLERRLQWDNLLARGSRVHQQIDETSALLYLVMKPVMVGQRSHDYVLLQSTRKDEKEGYIVASRSVIAGELPPVSGLNRGAVLPSGFVVCPESNGRCLLTYVIQMPPLKGISGSFQSSVLAKASRMMVRRFVRLQSLLEELATPVAGSSPLQAAAATALNDQL